MLPEVTDKLNEFMPLSRCVSVTAPRPTSPSSALSPKMAPGRPSARTALTSLSRPSRAWRRMRAGGPAQGQRGRCCHRFRLARFRFRSRRADRRTWRRSDGYPACCSAPPPRAPCRGAAWRRPRHTRRAEPACGRR
ncbi:cytochrome c oxidase subunit 6A1, mitochondrial isoform X2 [Zonotrichia albicollis]|uniref:cytochrome c oxidase subunit 6A1, mitochondrial isoform X2 n=1 Tax=Zonotrichia albicollis TaxID=44394 RepID=UPI003D80EAD3